MHMLICDDDARFAARVEQLVRACLGQREIPAEIVVCTSGEEALAVPDLELYQVALLDVDLDTMNGISLGRQLRERSPEICLIYISAYLEFAPEGYTVQAARGFLLLYRWGLSHPPFWRVFLFWFQVLLFGFRGVVRYALRVE